MKIVLQRVTEASVRVDGEVVGRIDRGLMILVGIADGDDESTVDWMADKAAGLRVFADDDGKMNRDVGQVGGGVLAVSQFTLLADCRKGRRPAMTDAAPPDVAERLYDRFCQRLEGRGLPVETGRFAADMKVSLVNDGPVTIVLEK